MQRQSQSQVTTFFDEMAEHYADAYEASTNSGYSFRIRQQRVVEMFDQPGGKVLDVGCGPGVMVNELVRRRGCELWGIDIAPEMIRDAERRFAGEPRAHFAVGAIEKLQFPDSFFDAVVCMGVVEYIDDDVVAIREMLRVLRPGGTLIVTVPHARSPYRIWNRFVWGPVSKLLYPALARVSRRFAALAKSVHHREYRCASYSALFTANGSTVEDVVYYNMKIFPTPLDVLLRPVSIRASRYLERFGRGALRWLGTGFIVKARKN